MTYHDEIVEKVLADQARTMGRPVELLDASTLGIPGERVTTVVYECGALDVEPGRIMVDHRATIYVEGKNHERAGIVVSATFSDAKPKT